MIISNDICEICGSKILHRANTKFGDCINGCIKMDPFISVRTVKITVFDTGNFPIRLSDLDHTTATFDYFETLLLAEIAYWKQDDRYLMKILGG